MLLTKQSPEVYLLIGDGTEYKELIKFLMRYADTVQRHLPETFRSFYQGILGASKNQVSPTRYVQCTREEVVSLFSMLSEKNEKNVALPQLLQDIQEQFEQIPKGDMGVDIQLDYQGYISVDTYEMILTFMKAFDLRSKELEEMVLGSYMERHQLATDKSIRGHQWETVYNDFFDMFQELVMETHLVFTFGEFQEAWFMETTEDNLHASEWLWLYMFYLEVIRKLLDENLLYEAEDKRMTEEWSHPYVLEFLDEMREGKQEIEELRTIFRAIYEEEIRELLQDVVKVENDKEEPYNLVFYLPDEKRLVTNTNKHFEQFIHEVKNGNKEVKEEDIRTFIQSITPSNQAMNTKCLTEESWEKVKDKIYPLVRVDNSAPENAIFTPLLSNIGVFYAIEIKENGKYQLALLMEQVLEKWGIEKEELYEVSMKNLKKRSPLWESYYEKIKNDMTREQRTVWNTEYKETYLIHERHPLNASYLLDTDKLNECLREWGSVIVSIPIKDTIFLSNTSHTEFVETITNKLFDTQGNRLSNEVFEWNGSTWNPIRT